MTNNGGNSPADRVMILHAPFSASSPHEELTVVHALALGAIAFTPDNMQALVVDQNVPATGQGQVFAISAPYSASSTVEWLQFPPGGANIVGFEDIDISPNGQIAALAGGCIGSGCPLAALHAPFTAAAFSADTLNTPQLLGSFNSFGRGAGTVHFWPAPTSPQPQIAVDPISLTEGNSGSKAATFTVRLSNPSTQTVTVDYATVDGSALAGSDYQASAGTLSFAPGQTHLSVVVALVGDVTTEPDESFSLTLSNPVNASVLNSAAQGVDGAGLIVNDDGASKYIITGSPLPDAFVGTPYSITFTAANTVGTPSWQFGTGEWDRPSGLLLDAATGVLSGVPTQASSYTFNVFLPSPNNIGRDYHLTVRDRHYFIFADSFE